MAKKGKRVGRLDGIEDVMNGLNGALSQIKNSVTNKGFIEVAMLMRRATEETSPVTPLDTGNLRASWFTTIKGKGQVSTVEYPLVKPQEVPAGAKSFQRNVVAMANSVANSKTYPNMIFGYSANYAAAVHEMTRSDIRWSKSGSGPKWFQKHLERNRGEIIKILAQNIEVKPRAKAKKR